MKQKIVIVLEMHCGKCRNKALKTAAEVPGVNSVALDGDNKDRVVVTGEDVDIICLANLLKKKFRCVNILTIEEVKPEPECDKDCKAIICCVTKCDPCSKCQSLKCPGQCPCPKCQSHKCPGSCNPCSKCHSHNCQGECDLAPSVRVLSARVTVLATSAVVPNALVARRVDLPLRRGRALVGVLRGTLVPAAMFRVRLRLRHVSHVTTKGAVIQIQIFAPSCN